MRQQYEQLLRELKMCLLNQDWGILNLFVIASRLNRSKNESYGYQEEKGEEINGRLVLTYIHYHI